MPETAWETYWALNSQVTYLNHGSFGACPKPILKRQQQLRAEMESEPTQFFRHLEPKLDEARDALATFVGADPAGLCFVPNATTAVNTVLRSLHFAPGDEILITDHGYNACSNAVKFVAASCQAQVVVAKVPFPITGSQAVVDAILGNVSPRTRLALIDHVTSPTALVFPIAEIVRTLEKKGVSVLLDGAHAPGMLPLNLEEIGASYYTGNCHKWLCAPKGSAFLYVRNQDQQAQIRPLVISHGANRQDKTRSRFHLEFDWTGTADPTPYLCIPDAIQFWSQVVSGGWEKAQQHNHELIVQATEYLIPKLGWWFPCPTDMIGSMSSLLLPEQECPHLSCQQLQSKLFERFHIEVPVIQWFGSSQRLIRISAQLYNQFRDYQALATALEKIRSRH